MSNIIDLFQVYQFITRLSTPFNETKAFTLGLINEKGKLLRRPSNREEKSAYNPYNKMIFNLKRLVNRLPGMENKFATFAAALFLLKENTTSEIDPWKFKEFIIENKSTINKLMAEEAPVNNVGAGNIAGTTSGEDPPITKINLKKYKDQRKRNFTNLKGRKILGKIK